MDRKSTRDGGFTLVELIVIIAIMAVLTGGTVYSVSMIPRTQARSGAENLVSCIEKTRTSALSFKSASLILRKTTDGCYADMKVTRSGGDDITTKQLGDGDLSISYTMDDSTWTELTADNTLELRFDRSSGAFMTSIENGTETGTCSGIRVSKGTAVWTLKLMKVTGKVTYE